MTSLLYEVSTDLLACSAEALRHTTLGIPKDMRVFVSPGIPVDDDCCLGQLAVYVVSMYPSEIFPVQDITTSNCASPYTATLFGVRITRCGPTVNDEGESPTPLQLQAAAAGIYEDAYAVWNGVSCCLQQWRDRILNPLEGIMGLHTFFQPEGGCIGSELQLTLGIMNG